jgi:hypothetical protein
MSQIGGTIVADYQYGNSAGAIVQVIAIWNYVHLQGLNNGNSTADIVLSFQTNRQGSSAFASAGTRTVRIYVNGTEITTVIYIEGGGGAPRFAHNRLAVSGRINSIQVVASITGNGSFGAQATASINKTITFTDISPTVDFVVVNSEKFLQLPDVTAHNRPIVIKSEGSPMVWIYSRDGTTDIDNRRGVYADSSYACVTVFSNGTKWFIAGWYNTPLPTTVNSVTVAKTVTAVSRRTNIFSTNSNVNRRSGHNAVDLPAPAGIEMCIIAYIGDTNASRDANNALQIRPPSGGRIDGYEAFPYIFCDSNVKSTGIVLFRNTYIEASNPNGNDKWYIIGWYNTSEWTWTTGPSGWHYTYDVPTNRQRFILFPSISWQYMTLPMFTPHVPQLLVYKVQAVYNQANGQDEPVIIGGQIGNNPDTMGNNFLNETQRGIIRYAPSEYVCVWFISEQRAGESFIRYYPIMSYIPP